MKRLDTRFSLIFACLISIFSVDVNAEIVKKSDRWHFCMKNVDLGAFKNNQWGACYIDEQKILQMALLIEMKQIMKELNEEQTNIAWAAYEYFKTYRETWCSFQKTLNFAPTPYVNYHSCLVELTIEHLNKIIQSQMANENIRPDPREYE